MRKPKTGSRWPGPPGPPELVSVGTDFVTLRWDPPKSTGGYAIIGYKIETRRGGAGDFVLMVRNTQDPEPLAELSGLESTTWYEFRVCAISEMGEGASSKESEPLLTRAAPRLGHGGTAADMPAGIGVSQGGLRKRRTVQDAVAKERERILLAETKLADLLAELKAARKMAKRAETIFEARHGRPVNDEDRKHSRVMREEAHHIRVLQHAHADAGVELLDAQREMALKEHAVAKSSIKRWAKQFFSLYGHTPSADDEQVDGRYVELVEIVSGMEVQLRNIKRRRHRALERLQPAKEALMQAANDDELADAAVMEAALAVERVGVHAADEAERRQKRLPYQMRQPTLPFLAGRKGSPTR